MPYVYNLSPEVLDRAKAELHEDPDRVEALITELRGKLEETTGYHGRSDDEFLLRFIRYRKFNLEMAQERIVRYYSVRNEQPDIFTNFVPSSIAHMLQDGVVGVLPSRDKDGRRVVIYRPGRWNYKNFPISDLIKTISIVNEYLMAEEETQVCGIALILDLSNVSWTLVGQFSPNYFKKLRSIHMHASPLRLRAICVIHGPNIFNYGYKIIEALSPKKLLSKIKNCRSDLTKMHTELCYLDGSTPGLEILPNDPLYGGTGTISASTEDFYADLLGKEDIYHSNNRYYVEPPPKQSSKSKNFFSKHFRRSSDNVQ